MSTFCNPYLYNYKAMPLPESSEGVIINRSQDIGGQNTLPLEEKLSHKKGWIGGGRNRVDVPPLFDTLVSPPPPFF